MSDNGAGALAGRLRRVNANADAARMVAVLRETEGIDLPLLEIDPTNAARLRMIPAIGGAEGSMPGTRPDVMAGTGELDVPAGLRERAHELAHEERTGRG